MSIAVTATLSLVLALMYISRPCYAQQVGLRIRPSASDTGKFLGQEFGRVCALTVNNQAGVLIEWLREGTTILSADESTLSLSISSVALSDAGMYSCKATLSNGTVLGPVNAGRLRVFDTSPIMAPSSQFLIHGSDATLNCSYDDTSVSAFTTVEKEGQLVENSRITSANLDDEGEYECDIFLPEHQASIDVPFTVHVIVPLMLISHPPGLTTIEGNPSTSLSVNFTGRMEQNIQITWYKDGSPLPANYHVSTAYDSFELTGSTTLDFSAIQRKDSGVYRVVLESTLGVESLSRDLLYQEISFQVNVIVPPTMPGDFRVEQSSITSVFARIRWTITNQTQDEGAETLSLLLTYSNMSLVQEIVLPGDATLVALDLIPGTEYTVRLRAENPSGMVITDAVPFTTLTGKPKVNEVSVRHLGETNFEVFTSLAYTGGGVINSFEISYRLSTSSESIMIENVPATSTSDQLVWTGTFTVPDTDFNPATDVANIQFFVFVINQFNYKSNGTIISVTRDESTTTASTGATGEQGSSLPPFWLFIVVAVLVTILVTITVVCTCICIVRGCKKSRKNAKIYKVNSQKGFSNGTVEAGPENSGQRYVMHVPESVPNNTFNPHSDPQAQDMNRINAIHNGSMPSIKTNSSSPTPQPDDSLLKKQTINYIHHQKYPSDASSIIKRGPTPSTTASSSPAPAIMKAAYEQRLQSESGRGSSISSSVHMEQYMPQCQQQQQGNGGEVENQQSSQTESENVHIQMQNETCSYQHQHHHQYSNSHHSHQSLNHSQSGSIPLYRVGTSTSNTSMPTGSSTQGSQPSLVNGSGLFHHYPTPHHHHAGLPYPSYGMPGPAAGGRAESLCSYTTVGGDSISEHGSHRPSICDSQLQTTV